LSAALRDDKWVYVWFFCLVLVLTIEMFLYFSAAPPSATYLTLAVRQRRAPCLRWKEFGFWVWVLFLTKNTVFLCVSLCPTLALRLGHSVCGAKL